MQSQKLVAGIFRAVPHIIQFGTYDPARVKSHGGGFFEFKTGKAADRRIREVEAASTKHRTRRKGR